MKTYSSAQMEELLQDGETLEAKQIGNDTYYLDKLVNGEFTVTKDANDAAVFSKLEPAKAFYEKSINDSININKNKKDMTQIKLNDLKKTGKELNSVLFDDDDPQIVITAEESVLKQQILEAAKELEDDELEDLSATTQATLKALKAEVTPAKGKKAVKKEVEPEEEDEETEETEEDEKEEKPVKKASKKPLKVIYTAPEDEEETEEDEEDETPVKKGKKVPATPAKEKKSKGKKQGPGVISTIIEMVEKAGKKGITREEIHEKLVDLFPDKAPDSMMNTIKVQLPSRINKEKFPIKTLEGGRYAKA